MKTKTIYILETDIEEKLLDRFVVLLYRLDLSDIASFDDTDYTDIYQADMDTPGYIGHTHVL